MNIKPEFIEKAKDITTITIDGVHIDVIAHRKDIAKALQKANASGRIEGMEEKDRLWRARFVDHEKQIEDARKDGRKEIEKELMAELRDPNGTIWEYAKEQQKRIEELERQNHKLQVANGNNGIRIAGLEDAQRLYAKLSRKVDRAVEVLKDYSIGGAMAREDAIKILTE